MINHDSQNHIPGLDTVTSGYQDILTHNRKHAGAASTIASLIELMVTSGDEGDNAGTGQTADLASDDALGPTFEDKLERRVGAGDMSGELQQILHSDVFYRIGIELTTFGSRVASNIGESASSRELVPTVRNTSLYAEFLSKLSPEEVQKDPAAADLTMDVVSHLRRLALMAYGPRRESLSDDERTALGESEDDILRTFVEIQPEYERLGIDGPSIRARDFIPPPRNMMSEEYARYARANTYADNYHDLERYVEYWGRNVLPEYIEGSWYLRPADDEMGSIANVHKDGGQRYWGEAIDFLARMGAEERTWEFGEEVRDALISSAQAAVTEAGSADQPPWLQGQRDDLQNILNYLSGREYDANQLAAYTAPRR